MRVQDIYGLIRDWVGLQKLTQVVAGNNVPSPHLITQFYTASCQTIQAATTLQNSSWTSRRKATAKGSSRTCKVGISSSMSGPPCVAKSFRSVATLKCTHPHEAPLAPARPGPKSVKL